MTRTTRSPLRLIALAAALALIGATPAAAAAQRPAAKKTTKKKDTATTSKKVGSSKKPAASTPLAVVPQKPNLKGTVSVDGSSTVGPLTEAAAELFQKEYKDVRVTVGISGTGGGFKKFCNGEIDVSDASRPINATEKAQCAGKGIKFQQFQVANDALTVVVHKDNTWAHCLTKTQLRKMWEPDSKVNNWRDVDAGFPNEPLKLFGAGTNSGTFDYFTEEIMGKAKSSRSDYLATEDDHVTVQGVSGSKGGLGYFGYSYFEENQSKLRAVLIDGENGRGCVEPSVETAQEDFYKPLSRPLFIYGNSKSIKRDEVKTFVEYYLANTDTAARLSKFIPLTVKQKSALAVQLNALLAS